MSGAANTPQRADHDLAFMLRYENVAWYEDGAVRILDRRAGYGLICETHHFVVVSAV